LSSLDNSPSPGLACLPPSCGDSIMDPHVVAVAHLLLESSVMSPNIELSLYNCVALEPDKNVCLHISVSSGDISDPIMRIMSCGRLHIETLLL
jgi:hypothetical protein